MNPSTIIACRAGIIRAQLNQPFRIALGAHDILENAGFILILSDKTKGYGEAAIASHITGETLPATLNNLKSAGRWLQGQDVRDYAKISVRLHEQLKDNTAAIAAVETAMVDALTRQKSVPLWRLFGNRPKKFKTDITIVLADLKETERTARKYYRQGFRQFKIKIGKDFDLDVRRCQAVKRFAPRSLIYLDANQSYSATKTLRFLKELDRLEVNVALLEQPVKRSDWDGLKKVTRSTKITVCADESARSLADAVRIIKDKAAGCINIKLMKHGICEAREIALLAAANNVKLMAGGMMETSLAMTACAHLAAGLRCFDYIDLDTPFFLKGGKSNPYLSSDGEYDLNKVREGVGLSLKFGKCL